jgi:hypothetical protein
MNRRTFIHTLMLSAGAASTAGAQFWKQPSSLGLSYKLQPKVPLTLELTSSENQLAAVFRKQSRALYMFGGPALARARNKKTSWMNFLIDCRDFSRMKRRLFEFGVEPISTPEMPGSFIKFCYRDNIYNVMNCAIDDFCRINRLSSKVQLIPFAHNFIVYDCIRREAIDPFGSLTADRIPEIQLVARPRTLVEGFDCVLSSRFEAGLLGFKPSAEMQEFDAFILNSSCSKEDVPRIVERVVNYLPDAIESLGHERATSLALSPLVKQALKTDLKVDVASVWAQLVAVEEDSQPVEFLALLKEGMGIERDASGLQDDLTLYLANHGYALRRSDLAAQTIHS